MSRYVLGIDGGGTRTRAVILNEFGELIGTSLGGPSNYDDIGPDQTQTVVEFFCLCFPTFLAKYTKTATIHDVDIFHPQIRNSQERATTPST